MYCSCVYCKSIAVKCYLSNYSTKFKRVINKVFRIFAIGCIANSNQQNPLATQKNSSVKYTLLTRGEMEASTSYGMVSS